MLSIINEIKNVQHLALIYKYLAFARLMNSLDMFNTEFQRIDLLYPFSLEDGILYDI